MADDAMSIKDFVKLLQDEGNRTAKAILRLRLSLANQIRNTTIDNIKKTFGENGDGAGHGWWPWRIPGHSGALMRSVEVFSSGDSVGVSVGGMGVPYAAIQEEGGTVIPKNGKFLAIPAQAAYVGRRPREFTLKFGFDPVARMFCLAPKSFSSGIGGRKGAGRSKTEVAFWLIKKATLPARPYFEPAIRETTGDSQIKALVIANLGKQGGNTSLEWVVK